mmetsp:Transcript_60110/g.140038  ORF Transcript_60110/g.140038 Transcript_60110/m.140038 type:complete len:685 (-) Transcript_60110:356-2410(-)
MATGTKSRFAVMQMAAGALLLLMCLLIVYMYQVIDALHRDQQTMRLQLAELTGTGYSPPHDALMPQPRLNSVDALMPQPRSNFRLSQQTPAHFPNLGSHGVNLESGEAAEPDPRKLMGIFSTGQAAGVGCWELDDQATPINLDVSSTTGCDGVDHLLPCPDCFVTPATVSQDLSLVIQSCSGAQWVRSSTRTGVWVYTFINTHATRSLSVTDNSGSPVTYNVPPSHFVQAFCASTLGTANKLYWPSTQLPTLTVDNGISLQAGIFDASTSTSNFLTSTGQVTLSGDTTVAGAKSFTTGTGTVSLQGPTTVADSTTFTVGSSGNGGATTMYGTLSVGSVTDGATLRLNGHFAQADNGLTQNTFRTATGAVYLNGHTTIAQDMNLHMVATSVGTFQTGVGAATINGHTTIATDRTFSTGTGTVSLNGHTTVADSTSFTVGSSGSGGATHLFGDVNIGSSTGGHSVSTNMYGDFTQYDDGLTAKSFATASGVVTLNGHTTVAENKNLIMTATGAGAFTTGTGTVTLNGHTYVSGDREFTSGTGQVSLNGAVQIGDGKPFSVGSSGAGGDSQLFGNVYIGSSTHSHAVILDVYGDVRFLADDSTVAKTFSTSTGAISLNGDVAVAKDRNLYMDTTGTGQFRTGTGPIELHGNTEVINGHTFAIRTYTNEIICNHRSTDAGDTFCKASR